MSYRKDTNTDAGGICHVEKRHQLDVHFTRYGRTRYWAVMHGDTLVAVVLYRKGAAEIVRRLSA